MYVGFDAVFQDWLGPDGQSAYGMDGPRLSDGDFHHGSTFQADLILDEEQTAELLRHMAAGFRPVFWLNRPPHAGSKLMQPCPLCEGRGVVHKPTSDAVEKMLRLVTKSDKLHDLTDAQFAEVLCNEVWAHLPLTGFASEVAPHAVERLKRANGGPLPRETQSPPPASTS